VGIEQTEFLVVTNKADLAGKQKILKVYQAAYNIIGINGDPHSETKLPDKPKRPSLINK
jgi:hypothetical protein